MKKINWNNGLVQGLPDYDKPILLRYVSYYKKNIFTMSALSVFRKTDSSGHEFLNLAKVYISKEKREGGLEDVRLNSDVTASYFRTTEDLKHMWWSYIDLNIEPNKNIPFQSVLNDKINELVKQEENKHKQVVNSIRNYNFIKINIGEFKIIDHLISESETKRKLKDD